MAYVRRTWQERVGTLLNRFTKSSETPTSVVLVNDPDTITQAGTPFTAAAMNNIEDGIVEALAKVLTGWIPADETWTYASADSPTFTMTIPGDKTGKYSKGMKLRCQQSQALTSYWALTSNANDTVGSNNGTAVNSPTYTSGLFSTNALTLASASSQYVTLTDATSLKPTGDFTIGFWFKTNSSRGMAFSSFSNSGAAKGIWIDFYNNQIRATINGGAIITGSSNLADNTFHYAVITFHNNWGQIYIDGILDTYGYLQTPVYSSTNYVRIGAYSDTGTSLDFFNGQIQDLFLINGYALDEKTIHDKYIAQTAQGSSAITLTKNFILSAPPVFDTTDTSLTMYGGTDYTLTNTAITNPFFSLVQQPYGFDRNPDKWSVVYSQAAIVNVSGSLSYVSMVSNIIRAPIGTWDALLDPSFGGADTGDSVYLALSSSLTSESHPNLVIFYGGFTNNGSACIRQHVSDTVVCTTSTYFHVIMRSLYHTAISLSFGDGRTRAVIRFKCAWL